MMALYLEAAIYALQIVSFFLIAGPVMVKTERRRTLAANPSWTATQPAFVRAHAEVDLRGLRAATFVQLLLLAGAAAAGSRPLLFAVHTVLFFALCMGFWVYYDRAEKRLRARIPEDPLRRAVLSPRRPSAFLPTWALAALGLAFAGTLTVNAWGYATGAIVPGRALGNVLFLCGLGALSAGLLRYTLLRASYRMSAETDARGRSMESSLTLATAGFLVAVSLYHSLGSWGQPPLFVYPPTTLHALVEGSGWSWSVFFERAEYRWVELGTALFIALVGPWLSRSAFTQRLLSTDPGKVRSAFEI